MESWISSLPLTCFYHGLPHIKEQQSPSTHSPCPIPRSFPWFLFPSLPICNPSPVMLAFLPNVSWIYQFFFISTNLVHPALILPLVGYNGFLVVIPSNWHLSFQEPSHSLFCSLYDPFKMHLIVTPPSEPIPPIFVQNPPLAPYVLG